MTHVRVDGRERQRSAFVLKVGIQLDAPSAGKSKVTRMLLRLSRLFDDHSLSHHRSGSVETDVLFFVSVFVVVVDLNPRCLK